MIINKSRFEKLFRGIYVSLVAFLLLTILYQLHDIFTLPPWAMSFITPKIWLLENCVFALIGAILYRSLFKRSEHEEAHAYTGLGLLDIAYVIFMGLMAYAVWNSIYVKPLIYYLFASVVATLLGLKIILVKEFKRTPALMFLQIFLFALIVRSSFIITNPYLSGMDSYIHLRATEKIVNTGHIVATGPPHYYPAYHILLAVFGLITHVPRFAELATLILNVFSIPFMFLLGKALGGVKAGLISSLFLAVFPMHIGGAVGLPYMVSSTTFLLASLLALVALKGWRMVALFWTTAMALFFMHPFPALVLIFVLLSVLLIRHHAHLMPLFRTRPAYSSFFSYSIMFVSYLVFVYTSGFENVIKWMFKPEYHTPLVFGACLSAAEISGTFVFETLLAYLGEAILIAFAVCGALYWVGRRGFDQAVILSTLMLLVAVPIINVYTKSFVYDPLGPMRSPPFTYYFLIPPAGVAFQMVASKLKSRTSATLILITLACLSFFSISSYHAHGDNVVFTTQMPVPLSDITTSTLTLHPFLQKLPEGSSVYADDTTRNFIMSDRGFLNLERVKTELISQNTIERGYYILNWNYLTRGVRLSEGDIVLEKAFAKVFNSYNRLFDSNVIQVFSTWYPY